MHFMRATLQASGYILKTTEPKKEVYLNNDLRL